MKLLSILILLIHSPVLLLGLDGDLERNGKRLAKEDQKWSSDLLSQILGNDALSTFEADDILPQAEKGKQFNPEQLGSNEIKHFVGGSVKKADVEGTEEFFLPGQLAVDNPGKEVGIIAVNAQAVPAEEVLMKCQEAGTYQISFLQRRVVQVSPPIKKQIKRCQGHRSQESFFSKSGAEEAVKKAKKALGKDTTLESWNVNIYEGGGFQNRIVLQLYNHKDDTPSCTLYRTEEILIQESVEKDAWETDFPEHLSSTEANPNCRLLYSQITEGPEIRSMNGQSIFRDSWGRQLFFSCESDAASPCEKLRAQGGVLVKKRCVKETPFSECELWEKTYDLGKKAAYQKNIPQFEEQKLWGFSDVFDASYDKNQEIGSVVSTLSIFSDMKKELESSGRDCGKGIEIFRGEKMQCQCSFIQGVLYDCCKKMNGLAVKTYLARCNGEEQALAERRNAGQCYHVGSKKENLGTQTAQVFCCFSTKLARILHEQGRKQLGIEWGTAAEPECRGFSLGEIQRVDFAQIDLSDAIEDLSIDKEEILAKVRVTVEQLQDRGQMEGKANTDRLVQGQKELKNGL